MLLDDGWSCRDVAKAFLLDDDTIRGWGKLFEQRGIEGLDQLRHRRERGFFERRTRRRFECLGLAVFNIAIDDDHIGAFQKKACSWRLTPPAGRLAFRLLP